MELLAPVFVLPEQIVFPHERLTLDARTAANISLFASVCASVRPLPNGDHSPPAQFAIATHADAPCGTVATLDVTCGVAPSWVGGAYRIKARCLRRYRFLRFASDRDRAASHQWSSERGYMLCVVRCFDDTPSPRLNRDECFPRIGGCPRRAAPAREIEGPGARTRSRARQSRRGREPIRTSLVGLPPRIWRAYDEVHVLAQIRSLAATAHGVRKMQFDVNMMDVAPRDCDSPALWSFWFAAALCESMSLETQRRLLEETCPILRLRLIYRVFSGGRAAKPPPRGTEVRSAGSPPARKQGVEGRAPSATGSQLKRQLPLEQEGGSPPPGRKRGKVEGGAAASRVVAWPTFQFDSFASFRPSER